MPISVACAGCEKKLKVPDTAAGKKIRCPACKAVIAVPEPEPLVEVDDDLVEPDEETAVTEAPPPAAIKKKPAWDKKEAPPAKRKKRRDDDEEEGYDTEEEEDDEDDRPRKKKKKKRFDDDYNHDYRGSRRVSQQPHRGVLILLMGIASIFCACICPLIAWIIGGYVMRMANRRSGATWHRGGWIGPVTE